MNDGVRGIIWQSQSKIVNIFYANISVQFLQRFYNLKLLILSNIQYKDNKNQVEFLNLEVLEVINCYRWILCILLSILWIMNRLNCYVGFGCDCWYNWEFKELCVVCLYYGLWWVKLQSNVMLTDLSARISCMNAWLDSMFGKLEHKLCNMWILCKLFIWSE